MGREAILSGPRNKFMNLFITNSHYFDTCIKSNIFFNAITCSNTVAMLASVAFYKIDTDHRMSWLPASHLRKKIYIYRTNQTKLSFFAKVAIPLTKFSQSEEPLVKHEKQLILTDHATNSRYKSHSGSPSTKLRLKQKYVNAYRPMYIFIPLNH
jgi:hypothetical protein